MLIKDIMHGIAVPFYSCNGSIKQQTYQLKLILSSILPPPPPYLLEIYDAFTASHH